MSKRRLTKKERDARDTQWLASIQAGAKKRAAEGNGLFDLGLEAALQMLGNMRVLLAAVLHGVWAHWTRYMLSVGHENEDGSVTIPAEHVQRWRRQMETPWDALTDKEQESDLEVADMVIEGMRPYRFTRD